MSEATQPPERQSGGISPGGFLMTISAVLAAVAAFLPGSVLYAFGTHASVRVLDLPNGESVLFGGLAGAALGVSVFRRLREPQRAHQRFAVLVSGAVIGLLISVTAHGIWWHAPTDPGIETGFGLRLAFASGLGLIVGSCIRGIEVWRRYEA